MRKAEAEIVEDANTSYESLFQTQYPRILRLCRLLLKDVHEAEEVTQEVFEKLVRQWRSENEILSWEAWLTRVAVNACHDRRRSSWWKWWRSGRLEPPSEEAVDRQSTPEDQLLGLEQQRRLWIRFQRLSPRQREVFTLRRLEGLSTEEVANLLGVTTGSVKRHLFHALRHLQKMLGDY
ncbi:MAG: RNA polymerase sigma factor [Candidatus Binatia bacterium]